MIIKTVLLMFSFLMAFQSAVAADQPKPNCKLVVRKTLKTGAKKVEILEVVALSREDCKKQAKDLQKNDDPQNIEKITVSTGWRQR